MPTAHDFNKEQTNRFGHPAFMPQHSTRLFLFVLLLASTKGSYSLGYSFCSTATRRSSWSLNAAVAALSVSQDARKNNGDEYTIRYSHTFRRHVVRKDETVLQSFLWLDEALSCFPNAKLLPIEPIYYWDEDDGNAAMAAGSRFWDEKSNEFRSYPTCNISVPDRKALTSNKLQVAAILEKQLKWFPSQVEQLFQKWPQLLFYKPQELEERLCFLLAPLPNNNNNNNSILRQVNYTEDIDWPVQFYIHGHGAGMSLAQVSHAVQLVPNFVFRLPHIPTPATRPLLSIQQLSVLYEQTPSVVLEMSRARLDAWLAGTTSVEMAILAYLHWKGWEWEQCRVLLHAWPCLLQPSLEAGWEVRGQVRKHLIPEALYYLQTRLQLRPWHLQAMFKTHSRLTEYNAGILERKMDFLQESLSLSCADLQKLVLQMPSLLGCSIDGLKGRLLFWRNDVGLGAEVLKQCVLQKPALMQYSLSDNLRPKLSFFVDELQIDTLTQLSELRPDIWGFSLQDKLRPSAVSFITSCGDMTMKEYGDIVARVPEILRCNWTSNLSVKIDLLVKTLNLSPTELKLLVQKVPWILLHSIKALGKKIDLVETATGRRASIILKNNPSLLLNSIERLRRRVPRLSAETSEESSVPPKRINKNRRTVALLSSNGKSVECTFGGAKEAAKYADTSVSNMYNALRHGRLLKGHKYVYSNEKRSKEKKKDGFSLPVQPLAQNKTSAQTFVQQNTDFCSRLSIIVSGYAFPPESGIRGKKRSGGMALQIPSWSMDHWREPCSTIWKGQKLRLLPDGQTVILGYSYTRPSHPRCSLYACREAIRVATQWTKSVRKAYVEIEIITDSNYVMALLQNTTQVLEWGRADHRDNFTFSGPGPLYKANPDILYPLSRSLFHLIKQDTQPDLNRRKNVSVRFVPAKRIENYERAHDGAKLAAKLMYERSR